MHQSMLVRVIMRIYSFGPLIAVFFWSLLAKGINALVLSGNPTLIEAKTTMNRRKALSHAAITTAAPFIIIPGNPCEALTPNEAETEYDVYAKSYDDLDGGVVSSALGIDQARRAILQEARGNVLEIGVGTGNV